MISPVLSNQMEVNELTFEFQPDFWKCFLNAMASFNSMGQESPDPMFKRTKATLFYDRAVNEFRKAFNGNPDVQFEEKHESITMIIKKRLACRIKKLNAKELASNAPTSRNSALVNQQLSFSFMDTPTITHIDIGYKPNDPWTAFDFIRIVCRMGPKILFSFDVNRGVDNEDVGTVVPIQNHPIIGGSKTTRKIPVIKSKEGTNG
jgi:hypothetical protein